MGGSVMGRHGSLRTHRKIESYYRRFLKLFWEKQEQDSFPSQLDALEQRIMLSFAPAMSASSLKLNEGATTQVLRLWVTGTEQAQEWKVTWGDGQTSTYLASTYGGTFPTPLVVDHTYTGTHADGPGTKAITATAKNMAGSNRTARPVALDDTFG